MKSLGRANSLGADYYLVKPFPVDLLVRRIGRSLSWLRGLGGVPSVKIVL